MKVNPAPQSLSSGVDATRARGSETVLCHLNRYFGNISAQGAPASDDAPHPGESVLDPTGRQNLAQGSTLGTAPHPGRGLKGRQKAFATFLPPFQGSTAWRILFQGNPPCNLVKGGRPGVAFVPEGRLRLGRYFSACTCAGVPQRLRPLGTPEAARRARRASKVGRPSGFWRRGSRRVWPAAWESESSGAAFQASRRDAIPLKCPLQGLKSLATIKGPCGTKAPPSAGLVSLTKWQWGLPWAKFPRPFGANIQHKSIVEAQARKAGAR